MAGQAVNEIGLIQSPVEVPTELGDYDLAREVVEVAVAVVGIAGAS